MKLSAILTLLILIAGVICPSQIMISHADDGTYLINLDICNQGGHALSADSETPATLSETSITDVIYEEKFSFASNTTSYNFLSVDEFLKPPRA